MPGFRIPAGRMRSFAASSLQAFAAAAVAILAAQPTAAQEGNDPKDLLAKAIAFHGGRGALEAMPHIKASGSLESGGRMAGRTMDMVAYERSDGGLRSEVTFEFRGRKTTSVQIYDGKMCKRRFRSGWDDLPLDEDRERSEHRLPFLLRALERNPILAGAGSEAGIEVWRIEVPDGRGKAVLSLAKDDGRFVAVEFPGTEAEGMGTKKGLLSRKCDGPSSAGGRTR